MKVSPSRSKLSYFYHVNHLLPCADFCPVEGQQFSCLVDSDTAILNPYVFLDVEEEEKGQDVVKLTKTSDTAILNPYVFLLLRLCNDVETNPGPGSKSPVKRGGRGGQRG